MAKDPAVEAHKAWIGYVQPVGLVVSIPALTQAQADIDSSLIGPHTRFRAFVGLKPKDDGETPADFDFVAFAKEILDWRDSDILGRTGGEPLPTALEVVLQEYHETLRPTFAVPDPDPAENGCPWVMLIQELPAGTDFDLIADGDSRQWQASPQARMERLLRETQVPIGLLVNGRELRLVYAPRGENSGHATFKVSEMVKVAGRVIFGAMHLLLKADRLFAGSRDRRLPALLATSRRYQSMVSNQLSEQVLAALYELLRGFQAANDVRKGELLREILSHEPNNVYGGMLTVLMRLVFILYAEDRDLMSSNSVYTNYYSITGLYSRLHADSARYPDAMNSRYGAWAQLVSLFRLIHDGGGFGGFRLPAREGYLFDPDRYPFLEGRPWQSRRQRGERLQVPRISDGVVYRVLRFLVVLDGERLSYRTLDVEQIGSVYERMMGFNLEVARGLAIAIKPAKSHGAPATINLEALLETPTSKRAAWLLEHTDQKFTGKAAEQLRVSESVDDLLAALDRKIERNATPTPVPRGSMVLQPSNERRKSGSHYTPRSLTEPIVRKTLEPVLKSLGEHPTPEQLLALKICDPAMGSGAFLVETSRQLGDELVKAWHYHRCLPKFPMDELLHARRMVAQRCLYGVDKNAMAVDLAKLSLWLATFAREHPFTFVDHNLRCGDSLVGLSRKQIEAFHWDVAKGKQLVFGQIEIANALERVADYRRQILSEPEDNVFSVLKKREDLTRADAVLTLVRQIGDTVISAFINGKKDVERRVNRENHLPLAVGACRGDPPAGMKLKGLTDDLRKGEFPVSPFHWEVEFPEVFERGNPGFDAMVGNPPFAGKNTLGSSNFETFPDWLKQLNKDSHGNADLVAHFFRRAFTLLRQSGCFGLIATKTIAQGDTRATGLRWICTHNGTIYSARKRFKWPGAAAVIVSVVHVCNGILKAPYTLDGKQVPLITAYLFYAGGHECPPALTSNSGMSFQGCIPLGMGFTFDDSTTEASPISLMNELIQKHSNNAERIFPFIGWDEVANSPTHRHDRFIINFEEMTEEEARRWPDLIRIAEEKVKPGRLKQKDPGGRACWWRFLRPRPEMQKAIAQLPRVLVTASQAMTQYAIATLPSMMVYSSNLTVFAYDSNSAWAVLQSRVHEIWARFLCATLKDDLAYAPSDCFVNFPFPENFETKAAIELAGKEYYEYRAALMVRNNKGLTETYNHFHDPEYKDHPDFIKLRELHAAMDRAVLDAYGWTDLKPMHEYLLDYEEDEDDDEIPGTSSGREKKKPWRFRWPDEFRDKVLARLLDLNQKYAKHEKDAVALKPATTRGRRKV